MAPLCIQLVARFPSVSGDIEDRTENVIHVLGDTVTSPAEFEEMATIFQDFFLVDTGAPQARPLGEYIASSVSRASNACSILLYATDDLSGATPFGPAEETLNFTLPTPSNATSLPSEVALVLSSHGDLAGVPVSQVNPSPPPATIRPASRRKGRMYFGPLTITALSGVTGVGRPSTTLVADMAEAAAAMRLKYVTDTTGDWAIWSKADAELYPVVGGYIDSEWDTQRRRGVRSDARTTFS